MEIISPRKLLSPQKAAEYTNLGAINDFLPFKHSLFSISSKNPKRNFLSPERNCSKLNMDGSMKNNLAEMWGFEKCLQLAKDMNIRNIEIARKRF